MKMAAWKPSNKLPDLSLSFIVLMAPIFKSTSTVYVHEKMVHMNLEFCKVFIDV